MRKKLIGQNGGNPSPTEMPLYCAVSPLRAIDQFVVSLASQSGYDHFEKQSTQLMHHLAESSGGQFSHKVVALTSALIHQNASYTILLTKKV
jgi:hypothetical protein